LRLRHFLITVVVISLVLASGSLWAADEPPRITITADRMWTLRDGTLYAEGEVVVQGEGVTVRAGTLRFESGSDTLYLAGGVTMDEQGGGSFNGDSLLLDLADLTGGISSGEIIVVPNGFRVRGEDIQRLAPEEFSVRKGVFTSCPGGCPDWSFTASEIRVHKEGYLTAKHAAFRILNVPVFYTPYLYYPVKTKRQTGLLLPEVRFSDDTGLESAWPFFLTLGPNADTTLTTRTFSRDSLGLDAELRYRLHQGGGGDWDGFAVAGDDDDRWYYKGEHAMALPGGVWFRGRFYDAGNPDAADLFGRSFTERHPGVVSRHATIEGRTDIFGVTAAKESLIREGSRTRAGDEGDRVDSSRIEVHLGPVDLEYLRADISGETESFEDGTDRHLISPSVDLRIPGPFNTSGTLSGQAVISTGGDGSEEDEAYILTLRERAALLSGGEGVLHRVDLEVAVSSVQGAAFSLTALRDGMDGIQERRLGAARARSRLATQSVNWDLEIGGWRDSELDLSRGYGSTRLSSGYYFVQASYNPDARWGLVLPSIDAEEAVVKGWQAEAGYQSEDVEVGLGREASDGYPDLVSGRLRFPFIGLELSGEAFYDLDADTMADEILSVTIPGRCWKLNLARTREPDRTSWKLSFDLEI
jgi:hypothetical protein